MTEQGRPDIQVHADLAAATEAALQLFLQVVRVSVNEHGRCFTALAGGTTPAGLYARLAQPPQATELPWKALEIFFSDERCVPPADPQSNYGMVKRTLLDKAPIPETNVHRIHGEEKPEEAATAYEAELRRAFGLPPGGLPRFDFILLGMGPDGHTASLFPHTGALQVTDRLVTANQVPQMDSTRITLTAPVLNNARLLVFLATGADKAKALQAVLEGPAEPDTYPSQRIKPVAGQVIWLVDQAAAARLRSR